MKRLTMRSILFLLLLGASFSMFAQSPMKGTWVRTNIAPKNMTQMSLSSMENVPEDIYYTFPSKITFEEEPVCILYYDNNEEKEALYYVIHEENSIYFSIKGSGAIPEKQFHLDWNQEGPESMQLKYTKMAETPQQEQYIYNYELQN